MIRRPLTLLLLLGCAPHAPRPEAAGDLRRLSAEYWEFMLRETPTYATSIGDGRYNDRLEDIGPDGVRRMQDGLREFARQVDRIDPADLAGEDRVTREVLKAKIELDLGEWRCGAWQWSVSHMDDGPQTALPALVELHPMEAEKDARDLLARFHAIPKYLDQYAANLLEARRQGRVAPSCLVRLVQAQIEEMLKTPVEQSPFAATLDKAPAAVRTELTSAIRADVYPAFAKLLKVLRDLPARDSPGMCAVPGGREAYRQKIRYFTTTDLAPERIHSIGLAEMGSLRARMEAIARKRGHSGSLASFLESLKKDRANLYGNRTEITAHVERMIARIRPRLPDYFPDLPKGDLTVKAIPEALESGNAAAYYEPPAPDRPGAVFVNTGDAESRLRMTLPSTSAHEGIPGHHLQMALALELDLPAFRRNASFDAYVEGWGLYAELLAGEMGAYETELDEFGMLSNQALRAARLVVDTGIHAFGWTRERAIAYFRENLLLSDVEIEREIDRYIALPGQALAYMIGRQEIQSLREAWLRRGGDLRSFHREVLRHGALPLSTLRKLLN